MEDKDKAEKELEIAEALVGQKPMSDRQFLENISKGDELLDHDGETCGMCYHRKIDAEIAREMLAKGDFEDGISKWAAESQRRWREGKFFKLWQEERAAGRDPQKAFEDKGWEA